MRYVGLVGQPLANDGKHNLVYPDGEVMLGCGSEQEGGSLLGWK